MEQGLPPRQASVRLLGIEINKYQGKQPLSGSKQKFTENWARGEERSLIPDTLASASQRDTGQMVSLRPGGQIHLFI